VALAKLVFGFVCHWLASVFRSRGAEVGNQFSSRSKLGCEIAEVIKLVKSFVAYDWLMLGPQTKMLTLVTSAV
jgi:hypothetical protein